MMPDEQRRTSSGSKHTQIGPGGDMQWCFSQVKGAIDDDVAEGSIFPEASLVFPQFLIDPLLESLEQDMLDLCCEEVVVKSCVCSSSDSDIQQRVSKLLTYADVVYLIFCGVVMDYSLLPREARQALGRISTVEFNHTGELLATGDKGGRVVIFQQEIENKNLPQFRSEYNVYSTFQSHEPEFDYLKSLEIEEKINKIRWLPQKNAAQFLLSTNDKTIKLWKISERDKRPEGYNLKEEDGRYKDPNTITSLRVPVLIPMDLMVEASPRRVFANAHTYHINSISVNSDDETYLSADDLRINLWHLEITDRSFNIVDIKPANMEELTEVITAAEFHPHQCNTFVYSSSKGTLRLCDMRASALCDKHSKLFEEPEDPSNRSFFSEIISSISDVKFSHNGRYMMTRDYLSVKIWDLNMENRPVETYQVHEYLRSKLCSLYENDCIFDKFECCWNGNDSLVLTFTYNGFDRGQRRDVTLEASRENSKPMQVLKPRKVCAGGKRKKDEISVDSLDFNKKILHTAWHPQDNIIAVATTNNLYIFQDKVN
ncbi:serine/threonine-protein phosphatase 2A 55 kDa regulatory subunit B alpha isoform-like [Perca fluviatilis]|uniref:serine/threonine-protein phosphatase 2A 55 kDa regulatory subunit B alpha isoform-like n=1 Tax=Perca fluviatilis TaxID=8168 RepID=UPI001963935A|nr:serine/threonine-protein phosphatase 2A 55 kDa regulatory subunit B alpha isoform-like [Perca fluviatilis]